MNTENELKFFYCYSPQLYKFLKQEREFRYICTGINPKTNKRFWQFLGTEKLNNALEEYKQLQVQGQWNLRTNLTLISTTPKIVVEKEVK